MADRWLMEHLEQLEFLRQNPRRTGLLFDLDGTLSPIVDDPGKAPFDDATRAIVSELVRVYGLFAIISGRSASALQAIVKLPEVVYGGNHGLEVVEGSRRRIFVPKATLRRLQVISTELRGHLGNIRGLFYEDKGLSLAIHYRGAADPAAAHSRIEAALASIDLSGFRVRGGKRLIQVRPEVGVDKGTAATLLLKERGLSQGLYAGDDLTDMDAFRALKALRREGFKGATIAVVDAETDPSVTEDSDYLARGVPEIRQILQWLAVREPRPRGRTPG